MDELTNRIYNHEVYECYNSSMKNITLSNLIKVISTYSVCLEVTQDDAKKSKMFIAHQTYEGLKITVHSIIVFSFCSRTMLSIF